MYRSKLSWSSEVSGQLHAPGKSPSTHWIVGWVDHGVGLDEAEKWNILTLSGLELHASVVQPLASRYTDSR
jgi:hypothetical protein